MLISTLLIAGGMAYAVLQGNYIADAFPRTTHSQHGLAQAESLTTTAPFSVRKPSGINIGCQMIGIANEFQRDLFERSKFFFQAAFSVTARDSDLESVERLFNSSGHSIEFKEPCSPAEFDRQMGLIKKEPGIYVVCEPGEVTSSTVGNVVSASRRVSKCDTHNRRVNLDLGDSGYYRLNIKEASGSCDGSGKMRPGDKFAGKYSNTMYQLFPHDKRR